MKHLTCCFQRRLPNTLLCVGGLLLVLLTVFHRMADNPNAVLVGPQNDGRNDLTSYFHRVREFPRLALSRGELPLWTPHGLGGIPHLGNPQAALFYPPNWLLLLFPGPVALTWAMLLHVLWGGYGMWQLATRRQWHVLARLTAATAFMGSPYLVAQTAEGHYAQICVASWIPWILLCYERFREQRRGSISTMVLVLALAFFAGHAQEVYYAIGLLTIWTIFDSLRRASRRHKNEQTDSLQQNSPSMPVQGLGLFGGWVVVGLGFLGLIAIDLLPIWQYSQAGVRATGLSFEQAVDMSWDWSSFRQLINPFVYGGPTDYTGPGARYWEGLCYFGVATIGLSGVGIWLARQDAYARRIAISAGGIILFILGDATPLYGWFYNWVPGGQTFRGPARATFLLIPLLAWLAGAGMNAGLGRQPKSVKTRTDSIRKADSRWHRWSSALACLMVLVLLAELAWHARMITRVIPISQRREANPVAEWLQRQGGRSRILTDQLRLSDPEAGKYDLQKLRCYEPVPPIHAALMAQALARDPAENAIVGANPTALDELRPQWLDLVGVKYAVVPPEYARRKPNGWTTRAVFTIPPEFTLRSTGSAVPCEILENTDVLPRAFVLGSVQVWNRDTPFMQQMVATDPRSAVWLPRDLLPEGPRQEFSPARIEEWSANRALISAELRAAGYLILSDLYAPGWRAEVNGQRVPILPAYGFLRAVPLPAGSHRIEFTYWPPGFELAAACSLLTLLLLIRGPGKPAFAATADRNHGGNSASAASSK